MAPVRVPVTVGEIRARFDREDCIGRALRHRYACCLKNRAKPRYASEPPGTESLILQFYDARQRFAFAVHCYLRPNGELGGSGKLDPKSIMSSDGVDYYLA